MDKSIWIVDIGVFTVAPDEAFYTQKRLSLFQCTVF